MATLEVERWPALEGELIMADGQGQRVAIITASGSGIGAACARALAREGFRVSLMSPSDSNIRLANELGGIGRRGSVVDNSDLDALVEATIKAYGRIDAVVNNMGQHSVSADGDAWL